MIKIFKLSFLLLICFNLFGQITAPHITNYTPKEYGALKSPEVWSIAQDDKGLMYFGFTNEIGVFDGVSWKYILLENSLNITSLLFDDGKLYFGAYGKFGYLTSNDRGHLQATFLSNNDLGVFSNIWRINKADDFIYFQSYEGIYVFDGTTISTIMPKTSFHLSFNCNNSVYVRQRDVGLMQITGNEMKLVNAHPVVKEYGLFDAFPISDKEAFIITMEQGLQRTSLDLSQPLTYLCADSCRQINNKGIIGGVQLDSDLFALYSFNQGCYFVNDKGDLVGHIGKSSGLASDEIKDAFVDDNGKLWLATGNGVCKVEVLEPFEFIGEYFGVEGNVQCLVNFNGKKYIGTSLGLVVEKNDSPFSFEKTSIKQQVWDLEVVGESLFLATSTGFFESKDGYTFNLKHGGNYNKILFDPLNNFVILAGEHDTRVLDGFSNWATYSIINFSGGNKTNIVFDKKNQCYWIGSRNGGILKLVFDGFDFQHKMFGNQDGQGLRIGEQIVPFNLNGSAVFGTPYDLLEFTNEQEAIEELKQSGVWNDTMINYPEFYPGSFFESKDYFIGASRNYQYYLQAGDGEGVILAVIDNRLGIFENNTFDISKFGTLELGRINFLQIEEEGLFVGGSSGLAKIDLLKILNSDSIKRNVHVNIRRISYNDSLSIGVYGVTSGLSIPYLRNKISFEFASSTIHNNTKPVYSWRLVGDDDNWSEWSSLNFMDFKNLHEGDYIFEVKAMDAFGNISEVESFSFTIEKPWYRTFWAYFLYVVVFGIFVYFAIELGRRRLKAQNQRLEEIVQQRTEEVVVKNKELEKSYHAIAEQKQEITDSINYAQRIQRAILPLEETIEQYISEYFVLFEPKDIVSGDFYWFANTNNRSIFVCADCTGHGVPGAFMSMIGSDKLNQAILEAQLTNPADILSYLNRGIKKSLKQNEEEEGASRDGMDATIISIDNETKHLQVSGAHNSLMMIRDGEIIEFKATKVAVAGFTPEDQQYELTEFQLQKGDCLYMTTDGYPDQFGGDKGKKLKIAVLKKLLLEICHMPMDEQKKYLDQYMKDWMGEHEQIDDICVVGIRI
ncbi:MAG: SpoIIE family protein phosphatase [Flavobacteriales bacterium]|nr:SpoIIE family protein phosphatase [Flavobacteriales bacterium]MCB9197207.1 SpoIIE family protein phosphatase [Flavobacteriales bacterium]